MSSFIKTAHNLTSLPYSALKTLFTLLDSDNIGYLNYTQFTQALNPQAPPPAKFSPKPPLHVPPHSPPDAARLAVLRQSPHYRQLLEKVAHDGGRLSTLFRKYDRNGDGYLSAKEFKDCIHTIIPTFAEEDVGLLLTVADTSGDGYLTYQELLLYLEDEWPSHSRWANLNQYERDIDLQNRLVINGNDRSLES